MQRNTTGGLPRHELCQHSRSRCEKKHASNTKEEIGDHRYYPNDSLFGCPAIPQQGSRIDNKREPNILTHPVFRPEVQFSVRSIPTGSTCLAMHNHVDPSTTKDCSKDIAKRVRDIQETDNERTVAIRWP